MRFVGTTVRFIAISHVYCLLFSLCCLKFPFNIHSIRWDNEIFSQVILSGKLLLLHKYVYVPLKCLKWNFFCIFHPSNTSIWYWIKSCVRFIEMSLWPKTFECILRLLFLNFVTGLSGKPNNSDPGGILCITQY